jgi:hypothetical protein
MQIARILAICLISGLAAAVKESPVQRVITLLEELKTEVEEEGKSEATLYDEFACFCKDTTKEKSDAIKQEQDNIEEFAASMQENTENSAAKVLLIAKLDQEIIAIQKKIEQIVAMRQAEITRFEGNTADISKANGELEGAIENVKEGKEGLLHIKSKIKRTLIMADAMDIAPKHHKALAAFLQMAEGDEPEEDEDHEQVSFAEDLIATFEGLDKQFLSKKDQLAQIDAQNKKDFDEMMQAQTEQKNTALEMKATAMEDKDRFDQGLAEATDAIVAEEATLKDDQAYLKDLTEQCEGKARKWDQQSSMRAGELAALTKALEIITAKVVDNSAVVVPAAGALLQTVGRSASQKAEAAGQDLPDLHFEDEGLSFLQVSNPRQKLRLVSQRVAPHAISASARRDRALQLLADKSTQLRSTVLTSLVFKAGADPFTKIKKLIQDLIVKLEAEAADESTKKGWCDMETGKNENTRNSNMAKIMAINAELSALEAKKAELEALIQTLTTEIAELNANLAKATKERMADKAENTDTLDKAKEGLAAVKDAYDVLASFYKGAAKGQKFYEKTANLLQKQPAGSSNADYHGNQAKGGGILAVLEVIVGDFERTIKVTTRSEKEAAREFKKFETTTLASIASKETAKSTAEFDLKSCDNSIEENLNFLDKHQKILDSNLMALEDLKPSCAEAGMSYEDRMQKRKDEIDALKSALCELDPACEPAPKKEEGEEKEE